MLDFLQVVVTSVTSLFLLVSSPFAGNLNIVSISPTPTPIILEKNIIKASGTYSYQGYSVNIFLEFPRNGGTIKGNFDGDCTGEINGNYNSGENGNLTGKAKGECEIAIFKINAEANLQGKVLLSEKKVELNLEGKTGEFVHNASVTLIFD